jgi:hypothetical protein
VPDTGRPPDLATLTPGELQRTRRDLAAALALAIPGAPARQPISTHLAAIDAELASRTSQHHRRAEPGSQPTEPDPSPPDEGRHTPGPHPTTSPGTGPDIEEVRGPLEHTRHLRLALDLLQEQLPAACTCDGLESELWALREKLDAAELTQLRTLGRTGLLTGFFGAGYQRPSSAPRERAAWPPSDSAMRSAAGTSRSLARAARVAATAAAPLPPPGVPPLTAP